jgi:hypothetical protein
MGNIISVEKFIDCLSRFPSSTNTIVISSGYIFSYENNILCFGKFPIEDLQLYSNFKNLTKILSGFDIGDNVKCTTEDSLIRIYSKNSSVEISSIIPDDHFIKLIRSIEKTKKVFSINRKEDFKEKVLLSISVARKDNLSGVLDCIYISEDGKIISSDNVRGLMINHKEKIKTPITIRAKTAQIFFKSSTPDEIKIFKTGTEENKQNDTWVAFFEESSNMHYCTKMPTVEKFPFEKFNNFFSSCRESSGRFFEFPDEIKDVLKKMSSFCEGKDFSKTATLKFQNGSVICSTHIPNGIFKKKLLIKNKEEFSVTINPGLFISPGESIKLKILQNVIYYKNNDAEYVMAVGE